MMDIIIKIQECYFKQSNFIQNKVLTITSKSTNLECFVNNQDNQSILNKEYINYIHVQNI